MTHPNLRGKIASIGSHFAMPITLEMIPVKFEDNIYLKVLPHNLYPFCWGIGTHDYYSLICQIVSSEINNNHCLCMITESLLKSNGRGSLSNK
jgi:hypothetical protein